MTDTTETSDPQPSAFWTMLSVALIALHVVGYAWLLWAVVQWAVSGT